MMFFLGLKKTEKSAEKTFDQFLAGAGGKRMEMDEEKKRKKNRGRCNSSAPEEQINFFLSSSCSFQIRSSFWGARARLCLVQVGKFLKSFSQIEDEEGN